MVVVVAVVGVVVKWVKEGGNQEGPTYLNSVRSNSLQSVQAVADCRSALWEPDVICAIIVVVSIQNVVDADIIIIRGINRTVVIVVAAIDLVDDDDDDDIVGGGGGGGVNTTVIITIIVVIIIIP